MLSSNDLVGGQKMKIVELVIWVVVGLLVLVHKGDPTKLQYGLVWIGLILNILGKILTE